MPTSPAFHDLGNEQFVSLTTFRRSGAAVATPVWVARDGKALVVTTPEGSGKVKRLRTNPAVELRPCTRRGGVDEGTVPVAGAAEVITDERTCERLTGILKRKYGLAFAVVVLIERIVRRGRASRVLLRITPV